MKSGMVFLLCCSAGAQRLPTGIAPIGDIAASTGKRAALAGDHVVQSATGRAKHRHQIGEGELDLLGEARLWCAVLATADLAGHEQEVT
jgi:hypothetical protein